LIAAGLGADICIEPVSMSKIIVLGGVGRCRAWGGCIAGAYTAGDGCPCWLGMLAKSARLVVLVGSMAIGFSADAEFEFELYAPVL